MDRKARQLVLTAMQTVLALRGAVIETLQAPGLSKENKEEIKKALVESKKYIDEFIAIMDQAEE